MGDGCKNGRLGLDYNGTLSHTASKKPCVPWAKIDNDTQLQSNYCRNPDESPIGPWCFIEKTAQTESNVQPAMEYTLTHTGYMSLYTTHWENYAHTMSNVTDYQDPVTGMQYERDVCPIRIEIWSHYI